MRLGTVLRKWRLMTEKNMRQAGREIGISAATLCRIEQGMTPDLNTFLLILRWLTATEKP